MMYSVQDNDGKDVIITAEISDERNEANGEVIREWALYAIDGVPVDADDADEPIRVDIGYGLYSNNGELEEDNVDALSDEEAMQEMIDNDSIIIENGTIEIFHSR